MTRSVVIAPQWIGDAVMTEPLLARLAVQGETLTVAALPWVAPVYRAMPQVGDVIELPFAHGRLDLPERRRIAAQWRGRYDTAYVLPNSIKAALIPAFARIPRRVGYHGEGRFGLLTERLRNPTGKPPMVEFYGALADGGVAADATPKLQIDAATRDAALRKAGVERDAYWVFAPGAEYGPAKCWPAEHYAQLAATLDRQHGLPIVLLGSAKEAALCESIAAAAPNVCRVLAGQTSLLEAMALIGAARGMVSNDSGLMHVAAAFGVPQVAMFGSTSPLHTPPLNASARVLWLKDELGLDCMPCFDRECRYGHYRCLTEIAPARAARALDDALVAPPVPAQAPNDNAPAGN
jgi:heptosyltransferase II